MYNHDENFGGKYIEGEGGRGVEGGGKGNG